MTAIFDEFKNVVLPTEITQFVKASELNEDLDGDDDDDPSASFNISNLDILGIKKPTKAEFNLPPDCRNF